MESANMRKPPHQLNHKFNPNPNYNTNTNLTQILTLTLLFTVLHIKVMGH